MSDVASSRRVQSANFGTAPVVAAVQFLTPAQVARFQSLLPRPTGVVAQIVEECAAASGFTVGQMLGPGRRQRISAARHMCMALVHRNCPHLSLTRIGEIFGGRDHSTVASGIARGEALLTPEDGA